ncbi:MAG: nucleoside-diphosphate kinase [Spirochaetales bacterium]|nr:MAG: nucleoside-diphosphate kinase [Spirochaetales bacterium]
MSEELSYVITTPYTLAKSRTGGILSRLLSRVDLELIAAQLLTPDQKTVEAYAASLLKHSNPEKPESGQLLSKYVLENMSPSEGRAHRIAIFLFRGDNAVSQLMDHVGALYPENRSIESLKGETIRDTYADLLTDADNNVTYFEPAVLTPHSVQEARDNLKIFAGFTQKQSNIICNVEYPHPERIQRTLVILKPDNWRERSTRPGSIIDMLSRTGLRVVGTKIFRMSTADALEFYGQVKEALEKKLAPSVTKKAAEMLEKKFSIKLDEKTRQGLLESFGYGFAHYEFGSLVAFMSGRRPEEVPHEEWESPGTVKSMILVYEGENAIQKIRDVLGPTDPREAPGGTVRRDFGSDVMVNAVHASDSPESAEREFGIVKIEENNFTSLALRYVENGLGGS